ncbi:MAG: hypothetical protein U0271_31500 [Polyangiaceae bacterium]
MSVRSARSLPRKAAELALAGVALVGIASLATADLAHSAPPSATERGLDFFLHGPTSAAAGDALQIDVQALGFPTATTLAPLPQATFEVAWDPESLVVDKFVPVEAPPPVKAIADAEGRASITVPVPPGAAEEHRARRAPCGRPDRGRTHGSSRSARTKPDDLSLFVSDERVVPGSEVVAWALFTSADGSHPRPGASVEFTLSQGGVSRFRKVIETDASGTAMTSVPIPRDEDPAAQWELSVSTAGTAKSGRLATDLTLFTREEVPGQASVRAFFDDSAVTAGGVAPYRVRVTDASGEAIAGKPVWVWSGPKGTAPPDGEEAFRAAATRFVTDGKGEVEAKLVAPSTIPLRGTELSVVAHTELEGRTTSAGSSIEVRRKRGYVRIMPEGGELVPGLEQRVTLELSGDDGAPLVGTFTAKADGLDATFTTDATGLGELKWKVPNGAGAFRSRGPCPDTVAAQIAIRAATGATGSKPAFDGELGDWLGGALCVPVHRDATVLARVERSVVRAGGVVPLTILGAEKRGASVVVSELDGGRVTSAWASTGASDIKIPEDASGPVVMSVSVPRLDGPAETVTAAVLVVPSSLPKLTGELTGGRAVPKGTATVTARLTDEQGKPLAGSVAAVMIDKFGGGSFGRLGAMDTRTSLCRAVGEVERCDELLLGGPEAETLRHARVFGGPAIAPTADPASTAKSSMKETFATVLRSLEGAVYEASANPDTLLDVRRKNGGKYEFNPELMTLVTDAMSMQPMTPGGEPVSLGDLMAIDGQITYDNVARRVSRLKLFNLLDVLRTGRAGIDPDEPILSDPNVFMRKLMREGYIAESQLIDPWGGRFSFYKAGGESIPFVTVTKGWELRSPGPDGKLGTADDVRSPFERVLKSDTPYANAVSEDRVVDARWDMEVSEATVARWRDTLTTLTGSQIGDSFGAGGLGMVGYGSGSGSGYGVGLGSVGTLGRGTMSVPKGLAYTSQPKRTDADGRVTFEIPLGDIETTWQVALVGLPDAGRPAVTTVDIPITVPLSTKVFAGTSWTDGDSGEVRVEVRNRSESDTDVKLDLAASGAITLEAGANARTVHVAKGGVASVRVPVRATGEGQGALSVHASASGMPEDQLTHTIEVKPRGELVRIARSGWVSKRSEFIGGVERKPFRGVGAAELVLDRGDRSSLVAALDSMHPEAMLSLDDLAEMAIASATLAKHFVALEGDGSKTAARAKEISVTATSRLAARLSTSAAGTAMRARLASAGALSMDRTDSTCPATEAPMLPSEYAATLDAEPQPRGGVVVDCWVIFASRATNRLVSSGNIGSIARGVVSLSKRSHRKTELDTLVKTLRAEVDPKNTGDIEMPESSSRADRALVYAALLLATNPTEDRPWRDRMVRWLLVQRDAGGSFGSGAATRAAVDALTRESSYITASSTPLHVVIDFGEAGEKEVDLEPGEVRRMPVPANATSVVVMPKDGGLLARVERTFMRSYDIAPQRGEPTADIDVVWPSKPPCDEPSAQAGTCVEELREGFVGTVKVTLSVNSGSGLVFAKVPLPPGATLAAPIPGVHQVQGVLYIQTERTGDLLIPLRFTLAGKFTIREATARMADEGGDSGIARARPIEIKPNPEHP